MIGVGVTDDPIPLLAALQEAVAPLRTLAKEAPAAAKAVTALHRLLAQRPGWTLALSSRGLVVDGERLKADDFQTIALESEITTVLVAAGLRRLRFEKGVRVEELGLFLESFARGFEGLRPAAAVNEQLAAAGVRSIRVDDTDAAASPPASDGRLPFDRARAALEDIAAALTEGPARLRDGLRRAAETIVAAFDDAAALDLRSILDRVPPKEVPPSVARAEAALAEGPWAAARLLQSDGDRLMRELSDLAPERGQELMEAVAGLLADRQAAARGAAAEALLALRGIWETRAFEPHREKTEEAVRAALEAEPDPEAHVRLLDVAGFIVETRLTRREIEAATPMVDVLRRHREENSPTLPHRADGARRALERLAAVGALQAVLPRIRAGDPATLRLL
ncbi:MAG TPA: hypothetical protein VEJ18_02915, partial [Planctomycetota bacterium]|nr:hypothetical protein [Planctomycetota bacterium]